jgi:hypothetical protein
LRPTFTDEQQFPAVPKSAVTAGREQVEGELAWMALQERWGSEGMVLHADGTLENQGDATEAAKPAGTAPAPEAAPSDAKPRP